MPRKRKRPGPQSMGGQTVSEPSGLAMGYGAVVATVGGMNRTAQKAAKMRDQKRLNTTRGDPNNAKS